VKHRSNESRTSCGWQENLPIAEDKYSPLCKQGCMAKAQTVFACHFFNPMLSSDSIHAEMDTKNVIFCTIGSLLLLWDENCVLLFYG
jgi:hypothetical protein